MVKDAIQFIHAASFYKDSRYQWVRPLIDQVLQGTYKQNELKNYLRTTLGFKSARATSKGNENSESLAALDEEPEVTQIKINQIKQITKIDNLKLVSLKSPIVLKNDLNIFYGKNGSGKSSLYLAVCRCVGEDKAVLSNIISTNTVSSCEIVIIEDNGTERAISWKTGNTAQPTNVKIFDSDISATLVTQEQENRFSLAPLKSEYFSYLKTLYDDIDDELESLQNELSTSYSTQIATLRSRFAEALNQYDEIDLTEGQVKSASFSKDEEEQLGKLESQILALEKEDSSADLKNLQNVQHQMLRLLDALGVFKSVASDKKELKFSSKYFETLASTLSQLKKAKEAFDQTASSAKAVIPPDWLDNLAWQEFIQASISFIGSLETDLQKDFSDSKCPYCLQKLQSDEAKGLLATYKKLRQDYESKYQRLKAGLSTFEKDLEDAQAELSQVPALNKLIEAEFKFIGKTDQHVGVKPSVVTTVFAKATSSISQLSLLEISQNDVKTISEFWERYANLHKSFSTSISELQTGLKTKASTIQTQKKDAFSLRRIKLTASNKDLILLISKIKNQLEHLTKLRDSLVALKKGTNSAATGFTREASLQLFKDKLEAEYKFFGFTPPTCWEIDTRTRNQRNQRYYKLRDHQLKEIFSEGEQKIHSLADFFANAELNEYKGIYIFDDPVTSLDEECIDLVAERIKRLAAQGNQVIVFTHNLVFLNCLVDPVKEKVTNVSKAASTVVIEADIHLGTENSLAKRLVAIKERIKAFEVHKGTDPREDEIRGVYDLMSGYLESYLEVKLLSNVICRYRPNIRMDSVSKLENLDKDKLVTLSELYKQTSRKGSRHSQPIGVAAPTKAELLRHHEQIQTRFK